MTLGKLGTVLTREAIAAIVERVSGASESGEHTQAWEALRPLLRAQTRQREAAVELTRLVERRLLPLERSLEVLTDIEAAHPADEALLALIGEALEGARDIDDLNSAPPPHPLFARVVAKLEAYAAAARGKTSEAATLEGLASAARMLGRRHDDLITAAHHRLMELDPDTSRSHYNYGLFAKTRGRFRQGLEANQRAIALSPGERIERYEWNLGICATGAGEGAVALAVWQGLGQKIAMGRFGLPEGRYPSCKVKLAERPLAERTAAMDSPGLEETIWLERLSPCHGIVRSVLYQDLGVDYGDVVLIDGAPITYHRYGEDEVPVFPHLATLVRRGYRMFDFAGTQDARRQLAGMTEDLDDDAIVYAHTESYRVLCADCWRGGDVDHEHGETEKSSVVTGRIAAPPHLEPRALLEQLDRAVAAASGCRLYTPALCEAAGLSERAATEKRRYELLKGRIATS